MRELQVLDTLSTATCVFCAPPPESTNLEAEGAEDRGQRQDWKAREPEGQGEREKKEEEKEADLLLLLFLLALLPSSAFSSSSPYYSSPSASSCGDIAATRVAGAPRSTSKRNHLRDRGSRSRELFSTSTQQIVWPSGRLGTRPCPQQLGRSLLTGR